MTTLTAPYTPVSKKCETCAHSVSAHTPAGEVECHRYPPAPTSSASMWPIVHPAWCGEYATKA
jgi:hypothetical protein